ncbi:MAG: hypothetical protein HY822_23285 [Acidobacteria bacterium]|nr:hypothetical protein [Acidobacteriota bacterium]
MASILALLLPAGLGPVPIQAHWDPPGPPPIEVQLFLSRVVFSYAQDPTDGIDGNAELTLTVQIDHKGHGSQVVTFSRDDFDLNYEGSWSFGDPEWEGKLVYTHQECSPRNDIAITARLMETDMTGVESWAIAIASAVAGFFAGGPLGAAGGGALGFAVGTPGLLIGNDDLGARGRENREGDQTNFTIPLVEGVELSGWVKTKTLSLSPDPCQATPAPPGSPGVPVPKSPTPQERSEGVFGPLQEALGAVPKVDAEPGNPARLTAAQLETIRTTLARTTLGAAEAVAGNEIEQAAKLQGVEDAIRDLNSAQQRRAAADYAGALESYRTAFLRAATARANNVAAREARLPLQISLSSDYLSTAPGKSGEILATVLGAAGATQLTLPAPLPNLKTQITSYDGTGNTFRVGLAVGDVPAGIHTLPFVVSDGKSQATRQLTLVVNPPVAGPANLPALNPVGVHNGASYRAGSVAPASYGVVFGSNLADRVAAAETDPPPMTLGGATVTIGDSRRVQHKARLVYASPGQVNFLVPPETATGPAMVAVSRASSGRVFTNVEVADVAPGLFSANGDGQGVAAAVALREKADGSRSDEFVFNPALPAGRRTPVPITLGADRVYLLLFGTGFRGLPARKVAVSAKVGGVDVPVLYAGPQGVYQGLDQVNLGPLPPNLAGRGEVEVVVTAAGRVANTVRIQLR